MCVMLDSALTIGDSQAQGILWLSQCEVEAIRLRYAIAEMVNSMSFKFEERMARLAKEQFEEKMRFQNGLQRN